LINAAMEVCVLCAIGANVDRTEDVNEVKVYRLCSANLYWAHPREKHRRCRRCGSFGPRRRRRRRGVLGILRYERWDGQDPPSARLPDGSQPRAVSLIVFHGDADETVHPHNGDQIVTMRHLLQGDAGTTLQPRRPS
jgi:hypothetical protein